MKKKSIVISGINLFQGGPLRIYYDFLNTIIDSNYANQDITIFVHKKSLFEKYTKYFKIIELPNSRKSMFFRLWYEYLYFYFYSKNKNIDVWISLHDITPNVIAKKRYVYCHNPSPFYTIEKNMRKYSKRVYLFTKFYKWVYQINIKKNTAIIVQQEWIRNKFIEIFGITNIIVAFPDLSKENDSKLYYTDQNKSNDKQKIFFYPTVPRIFKNIEVICEAVKLIPENFNFKVNITITGNENTYAKMLKNKYSSIKRIHFIGYQNIEQMNQRYQESDYLVFPSKIETWGLPISEFKRTKKPIILADEPYAHETLSDYNQAIFFETTNPTELSKIIIDILNGKSIFKQYSKFQYNNPFFSNWTSLINYILGDNKW